MVPGGTMETTDESEIQEELYAEFPPNLTYNDVASNDWLFWLNIPKFFPISVTSFPPRML